MGIEHRAKQINKKINNYFKTISKLFQNYFKIFLKLFEPRVAHAVAAACATQRRGVLAASALVALLRPKVWLVRAVCTLLTSTVVLKVPWLTRETREAHSADFRHIVL